MNKVQQQIMDKVVAPALSQIAGLVVGEVRAFNSRFHLGTVAYSSSSESDIIVKKGVPFAVTKGIKKSSPMPGDPVLIGFINNSYQQPVILAVLDKEHFHYTRNEDNIHMRKGSNVSDYYSEREGELWG